MEILASAVCKLSKESDIESDPMMRAKQVLEFAEGFESVKNQLPTPQVKDIPDWADSRFLRDLARYRDTAAVPKQALVRAAKRRQRARLHRREVVIALHRHRMSMEAGEEKLAVIMAKPRAAQRAERDAAKTDAYS